MQSRDRLTGILAFLSAICWATAPCAFAAAPLHESDRTLVQSLDSARKGGEQPATALSLGSWDFESGWQGWTDLDLTTNTTTLGHRTLLSSVPGSRGNGTRFSGQVVWVGELGQTDCGTRACFPGYANNVRQVMFKTYASVSTNDLLTFDYRCDAEAGYDGTAVIVTAAGAPTLASDGSYVLPAFAMGDTLTTYTGYLEGTESFDLSAYSGMGPITVCFLSQSDGYYADDDCYFNSLDGLFEIDNIAVGAGSHDQFETSMDGWTVGPAQNFGPHAKRESIASLPTWDPLTCGMSGQVVTMYDPSAGLNFHPSGQEEMIVSPVIDLTTNPQFPALGYTLQFDAIANLPKTNGNFYFWKVRSSPVLGPDGICLDANSWSAWLNNGARYFNEVSPYCAQGVQFDLTSKIPAYATRVQVGIGVINDQWRTTVPGGNQTPYFDNITFLAQNGPPGSCSCNPIIPQAVYGGGHLVWTFMNVWAGQWYDPPADSAFVYTMADTSLFTKILDFPPGFATSFIVSVEGRVLGRFSPGQALRFADHATDLGSLLEDGQGVRSFMVSGISPLVDSSSPIAFPLKIDFRSATANFTMEAAPNGITAVPPVTSSPHLALAVVAISAHDVRIAYDVPSAARMRLVIVDARGRQIWRAADGTTSAGRHEVRWNRRDASGHKVARGMYWARLVTGGKSATSRIVLVD